VLFHELVQTSGRVAETRGRLAKIDLVAAFLKRARPEEIETAVAFLSGSPRQGRIGIGYAILRAAKPPQPADAPTLELATVDATLERLAHTTGQGSAQAKERLLGELFARATAAEQEFLVHLIMGELRQGALAGLVTEAVARAAGSTPRPSAGRRCSPPTWVAWRTPPSRQGPAASRGFRWSCSGRSSQCSRRRRMMYGTR